MSSAEPGLVLGLDLGGTKLLGMVVSPEGEEPLAIDRVPTPAGSDALLDSIADLASSLVAEGRSAGHGEVQAVGLGAPGLVDRSGTLRFAPNLPGIVDLPLRELLEDRIGLPVVIDNDATCAGWAEHERGSSRGANHSVTITLGTGIGGGITVKGEVLRGAHGYAGEAGHMVVDIDGIECPCGRRGCWERYASGSALGGQGRDALVAALAAGRPTILTGMVDGDPEAVRGEHVTDAALAGDEVAQEVLAGFGRWVAIGLVNLVNVLDSEIVVLGGGLIEVGDLLMDPVRRAYEELVLGGGHRDPVPIVAASLGERAGAWGAALLAAART